METATETAPRCLQPAGTRLGSVCVVCVSVCVCRCVSVCMCTVCVCIVSVC